MDQGSTLVLAASAFVENSCYLCRCGKGRGPSGLRLRGFESGRSKLCTSSTPLLYCVTIHASWHRLAPPACLLVSGGAVFSSCTTYIGESEFFNNSVVWDGVSPSISGSALRVAQVSRGAR